MMPKTVTLVRHGESESNRAQKLAEEGLAHENEKALMGVHTSLRRLTPKGVEQARAAGAFMRTWMHQESISLDTCRFYVSPYARTMETAGHMDIVNAQWRLENRIVERNWGSMDQLTYADRMRRYGELKLRKEHAFFWRPSDGETMQDVFNRYRDLVGTMHRDCSEMHVVIVAHGELMWAARTLHEYWSPHDLRDRMMVRDDRTRPVNCRIVQYSRRADGGMYPSWGDRLNKVRFIDPVNPDNPEYNLGWQPIKRQTFSSGELLARAEQHPRFGDS